MNQSIFTNRENANKYNLLNKDIETQGKYFDVVPDGNLFTMDDMPIFAVRMRPMGIAHIMNIYEKKYHFHTDVLTYKINTDQYTLYSNNSQQMYNTQRDILLKYFNFDSCKSNEFKGIIIVITNNDNRMIHAIPYIYGVVENRKKIIFLDPFFAPDMGSGCVIGADFFYRAYNGNIDCYCHGETVQADHHSCGIIACDFIKNCLSNNYKIVKKILSNVLMRTEVYSYNEEGNSYINIFDLPTELRKFAQVKFHQVYSDSIENSKTDEEKKIKHNWFINHIKTLIYRRDPEPYNPNGKIYPDSESVKKEINTSLIEKGHKYAGWIVKDLKQQTDYNSKYWISLIREQCEGNIIKKLIRKARKMITKNNK